MEGPELTARTKLLARALKYRYRQDPQEIRIVRQLTPPGGVALDIGAHKGAYTYWLQRAVGPNGRVIAFEPQVTLALSLARLFASARNVTVENLGVSSRDGTSMLAVPDDGPSPGARIDESSLPRGERSVPIRVTTIDRYVAEHGIARVDFIKCDVEGHELDVFEGATATLAAHRPAILFECEERHRPRGGVRGVFDFLSLLGYDGSYVDARGTHPVAEFDPARHQRDDRKPYVNNFIFTAKRR